MCVEFLFVIVSFCLKKSTITWKKKTNTPKPTHHHFLPHNTLECSHHETSNSECHGLWCRLLNAAIFFFICQQSVRIEKQYGEEMWKFLLVFLCVGVVDAASLKHRKRVRKSLRTGWREKKGNILRKHLENHLSCLIIQVNVSYFLFNLPNDKTNKQTYSSILNNICASHPQQDAMFLKIFGGRMASNTWN